MLSLLRRKPMAKKDNYIVGFDIGSKKTKVVIGEINEERKIEVVGIGVADSGGLRKGVVVDLEATVEGIKKAVEEAELMAGIEIDSAYVSISGAHIRSFNSRGVIAVSGKNREITRDDVNRVVEQARTVSIPPDREVIHVLPQEFIVDDQDGIKDPIGISGIKLEVNVHIVTSSITATQNLITCVHRAGIEVEDVVLSHVATSSAVLTPDEKELGVGLIDIGGGTTDIAIYERGSLWYTTVMPIGGDNFTNDLAIGLRTAISEAEKIKKRYGCVVSSLSEEDETIEVKSVGGRKPRILPKKIIVDIIQPRAEEIFRLINEDIKRMGYEKSLNSGLVLTGGGALLEGLEEIAEEIFDLPVRRGNPTGVIGLVDRINSPEYATSIGLLLYGYKQKFAPGAKRREKRGFFKNILEWLKENF